MGRRGGENWSITSSIIIFFWLVWQIDQVSVITCDQDTLSQNIPSYLNVLDSNLVLTTYKSCFLIIGGTGIGYFPGHFLILVE